VTRTVQVVRAEQRTGKRTVYESVAKTREITVPVCAYESQQREGVRTKYERVPEQVTRHRPGVRGRATHRQTHGVRIRGQDARDHRARLHLRGATEREGVRTKYERVPEQVTRRVQVCEMEPYTETVQVLVKIRATTAMATTAAAGCSPAFR